MRTLEAKHAGIRATTHTRRAITIHNIHAHAPMPAESTYEYEYEYEYEYDYTHTRIMRSVDNYTHARIHTTCIRMRAYKPTCIRMIA